MELFRLFDTSDFPPRWQCGVWSDAHGWLHILSDLGIWSAYLAIPLVLVWFARKRRDLPFKPVFLLFGAFILLCGTTHLMEAVIFWWPGYRLAGLLKLATAAVSWATVVALVRVLPGALALRSPADSEREVAARTAELQAERELLRTTLASIGDGVIVTDTAGRVTFLNGVAEALTGWRAADARGVPLEDVFRIVNESTRRPVDNPALRALADGTVVGLANHTILLSRHDAAEWPIDDSAAPIRDAAGTVSGAVLVFREISERKRQEAELRRAEAQFRALAESIPQLAWMARADGHIFWYNRRWYDYTGTTPEQMEGWGWKSVHDPYVLPNVMERWTASIASGRPFDMVFPLKGADGVFRPFLTRVMPQTDEAGRVTGWFGTNTDVSELRRAEEAERERARLAGLRADAADALARGGDEAGVLAGVAGALVRHAGVALARIWVPEPGGRVLVMRAAAGVEPATDGPLGVLTDAVPPAADLCEPDLARRERLTASASFPLNIDGVAGVLAVFARAPLAPAARDDIEALADAAALWLGRSRTEAALRESEARYRLVGQAANDAIWDWDLVADRVEWSESLHRVFGHGADDVGGGPDWWLDNVHPEDRGRVAAGIRGAIAGTGELWSHEYRFRRADGTYAAVFDRGRVVRDDAGRATRMVGSMLDLTERKSAEDAARRRSEQLKRLAEAATEINVAHDVQSVLGVVTNEARGLLGARVALAVVSADPLRGHPAARFVSAAEGHAPPELLADPDHPPPADGPPPGGWLAAPLVGRDGRSMGLIQLADRPGGPFTEDDEMVLVQLAQTASVAVENARLYEQLREADERKNEFLATLAHELRNPLAPVRNSLAILERARDNPEISAQARDTMRRQMAQMVRLIDDLMDVSRITRGKLQLRPEAVELAAVARTAVETARPLIEEAGHALTVDLPDAPVPLTGDPTRLAQVLSNLLNNSAKYTEPGGSIRLWARREDGWAVVSVRDSGVGIPPEKLASVFEMFSQLDRSLERAQGGLGIGLTLVQRLVEMHGGTVTAESDGPGTGSTFTVRLPLTGTATPAAVADAPAAPRRRVLIVDDSRDAAASLATLVRLAGNEVRVEHDGEAAVAAALGGFAPDVVLLDIGLPRLNGYDAARRIREGRDPKPPVLIAVTGWGQDADRRRSAQAGFDHHVVKPVDPDALQALLDSLGE